MCVWCKEMYTWCILEKTKCYNTYAKRGQLHFIIYPNYMCICLSFLGIYLYQFCVKGAKAMENFQKFKFGI